MYERTYGPLHEFVSIDVNDAYFDVSYRGALSHFD